MKINIKQVLSESASFYKENFKKLIGISFIVFIFMVFMQVTGYTQTIFTSHPSLFWLYFIVIDAILILAIITLPKLALTMSILINSLFGENKLTTKQAYRLTKGKYWLMVRCFMLVGILYIPFVVMIPMKIPFASIISSICVPFISSLFYALFPMIAIEPKTKQYLRKSIKMIKGNYRSILILTFLTLTLLNVVNGALIYLFQGQTTALFIIGLLYTIVYFFVYPFISTVTIVVYRQLKANQQPFDSTE